MIPMHYAKPTLIKAQALPKNDRQSLGIVPMHYATPTLIKAKALPKNAVNLLALFLSTMLNQL